MGPEELVLHEICSQRKRNCSNTTLLSNKAAPFHEERYQQRKGTRDGGSVLASENHQFNVVHSELVELLTPIMHGEQRIE